MRGFFVAHLASEANCSPRAVIAASTAAPSTVAPKVIVVVSILANPTTVAVLSASSARQSPSGTASGGGSIPVTVATAERTSVRGIRISIASHTSETRTSPSSPQSRASSRTWATTTRIAEALASFGCLLIVCLSASVRALAISSVLISRSSSSRASSVAVASSCATVATSVAIRR